MIETYQFTLVVGLVILCDLRYLDISSMIPHTRVGLEEDEGERRW